MNQLATTYDGRVIDLRLSRARRQQARMRDTRAVALPRERWNAPDRARRLLKGACR
jgi:hypothetical protein